MPPIHADTLKAELERHCTGIDTLAVLPPINLRGPLVQTLHRLGQGLVPESYGWTEEKTAWAYGYRGESSWVRSIIVAAKYYYTDEVYPDTDGYIETGGAIRPYGRIARFTWRNNYRYLTSRLGEALGALERVLGNSIRARVYSNYTSIPEKVLFAASGLGSIGRNSVLLNKAMGSLFVVGEAVTDLRVDFTGTIFEGLTLPTEPDYGLCGNCMRCIERCPTGAIKDSGTVDVNRCLQYLSENTIPIAESIRRIWGNRLYGCTTCMDVCPYNERLEPLAEKHDTGYVGQGEDLINLLNFTPEEWQNRFLDNQIGIRDRLAILQNGLLCMGNLQYEAALTSLAPYLSHKNSTIRIAAAWAISRHKSNEAKRILERSFYREEDPQVREEIELLLQ